MEDPAPPDPGEVGAPLFRFEGVADDAGLVPASNALPTRSPVGDGRAEVPLPHSSLENCIASTSIRETKSC